MSGHSNTISCPNAAKGLTFLAACIIVVSVLALPSRTQAGTSYEQQIAGFVVATLGTFIVGEFAGRSPPDVVAQPGTRTCMQEDYEKLRFVRSKADLEAFALSCFLVEIKTDRAVVRAVAHLPVGYCELLKAQYSKMLEHQVYAKADSIYVIYEHKGAHFRATSLHLAKATDFGLACVDGTLQINAKKARR